MSYLYLKKKNYKPISRKNVQIVKAGINFPDQTKLMNFSIRIFSLVCLVIGIILIGSAIFPLISFRSPEKKIILPVPENVLAMETEIQDTTNISSWIPEQEANWELKPTSVSYYNLSIPSLKIKNAVVEVGGVDLSKNLIQYKGTAFPGQIGNTVIFGHSSLPVFFNPTNYRTIFATLPEIKKGDKILLDFDGVNYEYRVFSIQTTSPGDLSPLEQSYNDAQLTLITCVPPGTLFQRLVVRASLKG